MVDNYQLFLKDASLVRRDMFSCDNFVDACMVFVSGKSCVLQSRCSVMLSIVVYKGSVVTARKKTRKTLMGISSKSKHRHVLNSFFSKRTIVIDNTRIRRSEGAAGLKPPATVLSVVSNNAPSLTHKGPCQNVDTVLATLR